MDICPVLPADVIQKLMDQQREIVHQMTEAFFRGEPYFLNADSDGQFTLTRIKLEDFYAANPKAK